MRKSRIMVVDDDRSIRVLLRKVLEGEGYQVFTASSAEEAVDTLSHLNGQLDLVVTDVNLPGMSGLILGDKVQKEFPDLRVLFVSGAKGLEVEPLIQKPFPLGEVLRQVRRILSPEREQGPDQTG